MPPFSRILLIVPGSSSICEESLALGCLAAVLRSRGQDVEIMDRVTSGESLKSFSHRVGERGEGAILGFTIMSGPWLDDMKSILEHLKGLGIKPYHRAAGGMVPSLIPEEILKASPDIDSVFSYEGEVSFSAFVCGLSRGMSVDAIPGRIWRREEGSMAGSGIPGYIRDLDSIPFPARDTLPEALSKGAPALIQASRGCYGSCGFCSQSFVNRKLTGGLWRGRSPQNIAAEVKEVIETYRPASLKFVDENFFNAGQEGQDRAQEIARLMKRKSLFIPFRISARAQDLNEETLKILMDVGLDCIHVGIEAGSQNALTDYGKNMNLACARQALSIIRRLGLKCAMGFILFRPETRIAEIRESLAFIREEAVGLYHFPGGIISRLLSSLEVYYGTSLYERYRQEGLLRDPSEDPHRYPFNYLHGEAGLFRAALYGVAAPLEQAFSLLDIEKGNEDLRRGITMALDQATIHWAEQLLAHIEHKKPRNPGEIRDFLLALHSAILAECRTRIAEFWAAISKG
jgi:anaerobic magnesium-protoporphyrin IX monomethyl ester cyclase